MGGGVPVGPYGLGILVILKIHTQNSNLALLYECIVVIWDRFHMTHHIWQLEFFEVINTKLNLVLTVYTTSGCLLLQTMGMMTEIFPIDILIT